MFIQHLKGVFTIEEVLIFSLTIVMTGLSLLLFVVSLISYLRIKDSKFLFVTLAFLLFFIKGAAVSLNYVEQQFQLVIIDLFIILFLYLTVVKR